MEPSIDNQSIYITDYTGSLYALNMLNGKRLWSLKDKGTEYTTSPGVGSDLVLVGTGDGRVIARSKESECLNGWQNYQAKFLLSHWKDITRL